MTPREARAELQEALESVYEGQRDVSVQSPYAPIDEDATGLIVGYIVHSAEQGLLATHGVVTQAAQVRVDCWSRIDNAALADALAERAIKRLPAAVTSFVFGFSRYEDPLPAPDDTATTPARKRTTAVFDMEYSLDGGT